MPTDPEHRPDAEHQLRQSLTRALRKRGATQMEHETGMTMHTVRRFIAGESVPQKKTMGMLWLWAYKFGDGEAKERAEGELQTLGVSPLARAGRVCDGLTLARLLVAPSVRLNDEALRL